MATEKLKMKKCFGNCHLGTAKRRRCYNCALYPECLEWTGNLLNFSKRWTKIWFACAIGFLTWLTIATIFYSQWYYRLLFVLILDFYLFFETYIYCSAKRDKKRIFEDARKRNMEAKQ